MLELAPPQDATSLRRVSDARLLRDWLTSKTQRTAKHYHNDLEHFARWRGEPSAEEAVRKLLEAGKAGATLIGNQYRVSMVRDDYAPNTVNRRLAALRSVVKLALQYQLVDWTLEIDGVRTELVRDVRGPDREAVRKVVDQLELELSAATRCGDDRAAALAARDLAYFRLLHDAGMRRFEPLSADYPDGVRLGDSPEIEVLRKGKRAKSWWPVGAAAGAALATWLRHRGTEPGPLFCAPYGPHKGKRLNVVSAWRRVRRGGEAAGLKRSLRPHGLRHTAATTLLEATSGDVRRVAAFLGHANLDTVQRYDDERTAKRPELCDLLGDLDDHHE